MRSEMTIELNPIIIIPALQNVPTLIFGAIFIVERNFALFVDGVEWKPQALDSKA